MSSGTVLDPYAARRIQGAYSNRVVRSIEALGLSPRQQALNDLWAWFRCQRYDSRRVDWDGKEHSEGIDHHAISRAGYIPPGFYDAGNTLPIKFRRPTAPYALVKVVVDRFTGLLFSERRHPQLRCPASSDTEDFVRSLVDAGRLWQTMIQARTFGGAMGSVAIGFQFLNGKPTFEVHDPRWVVPDFEDRFALRLRGIEKRYQYPQEVRDPETGAWVERPTWYRRTIDAERDVLYRPAPVEEDGSEPDWQVDKEVEHGLGFCPVVWVQNLPVQDDIDGDPDCHGIYDVVETIDALLAQANRGVLANCDPTLLTITDAQLGEVVKGSGSSIKLPVGSDARYVEISGTGPVAARDLVKELRAYALEVAQCVLDHPDSTQRTATEVERVYSSMLAKADVLREQYGQKGVLPLVTMALEAAEKVTRPRQGDGAITRGVISLPGGKAPPQQGQGQEEIEVQWGPYFEPTLQDIQAAAAAAATAKEAGLVDSEHAAKFVAQFFRVEDVPAMLDDIDRERQEEEARASQAIVDGLGRTGTDDDDGGEPQ